MTVKATAARLRTKLRVVIAFFGVLLGALARVAHAECTCNSTCGDCLSCPHQYETVGSCSACYASRDLPNSVLCSFICTPASASIRPLTPDGRLNTEPRSILPGTRPDTNKPDLMV